MNRVFDAKVFFLLGVVLSVISFFGAGDNSVAESFAPAVVGGSLIIGAAILWKHDGR